MANMRNSFNEGDRGISDAITSKEKAIGEIISLKKNLSSDQVASIVAYQQEHAVRFGDAAVALALVNPDEVLDALSNQFQYHYVRESVSSLNEELVMANQPFSESVEFFRDLRSQLIFNSSDSRGPALAVVSPGSGEGKTFITANLGVAFSQLPGRTLIIDADMRVPRMHRLFGIESSEGLSSVLSGRSVTKVISPVGELPNLFILPVGTVPPNPVELLQRSAFGELLRELATRFDYILVDAPAATHGSDSRIIAAQCGAALSVGRKNSTELHQMQLLVNQLGKLGVRNAGVLLNQF